MRSIVLKIAAGVFLSSLTLCQGAEEDRFPDFSWDTVPRYMHVRKSIAFTKEEIQYLATFPLITFEKTTGMKDSGSTEKGTLKAAKAVKQINPRAKILYYRNILVHYGVDSGSNLFWMKSIPEYSYPLGAPKGSAVKRGYTYIREFEHVRVLIDVQKEQAEIIWKKTGDIKDEF